MTNLTKQEYLQQLEGKLAALPERERTNAINYYQSYLADDDDAVLSQKIASLGTPGDVAAEIFASYVKRANQTPPQPTAAATAAVPSMSHAPVHSAARSGLPWWLIIVIVIFASPVLIGLAGGAFGILTGIGAAVIGFAASGFAMFLTGAASIVLAIPVMFHDTGFGFLVAGSGLVLLGLGILFFKLAALICSGIFSLIQYVIRRLKHGRVKTA